MRKYHDERYMAACDAGIAILMANFSVPPGDIDYRWSRFSYMSVPPTECADVFTKDGRYGVVIGILRESTLLKLLGKYEAIIHLPLPEPDVMLRGDPTHFRAFFRNKSVEGASSPIIWGGSLTHARSRRKEGIEDG